MLCSHSLRRRQLSQPALPCSHGWAEPTICLHPTEVGFQRPSQCNCSRQLCQSHDALYPQVCSQLCRRPCYCSQMLPRCPRGSPLVLDGCGCCRICARRLGEPCDFLHVCDRSQGLICDYSSGTGGTCNCEQHGWGPGRGSESCSAEDDAHGWLQGCVAAPASSNASDWPGFWGGLSGLGTGVPEMLLGMESCREITERYFRV